MKKVMSMLVVVCTALLLSSTAFATVDPSNLVGWWETNENADDSSGNSFDGTTNGDTYFDNVDTHKSAVFDGDGDYIEIPDTGELDIPDTLTVEGWIKLNSIGTGNQATVAAKWNDLTGNNREYLLTVNQFGQASFYVSTTGANYPKAMWSTPLTTGVWYHLAGTYDGSDIKLYVDGDLKSSTSQTGALPGNDEPVLIGANDGYGGSVRKYTYGYVSDVRIWNVALSEEEINTQAQEIHSLLGDGVCYPVSTSKGAFTTKVIAQNDDVIDYTVNALGCNIGVFIGDSVDGVSINSTSVHDSNNYGIFSEGNVVIDSSEVYNIGNHTSDEFDPNGSQTGLGIYFTNGADGVVENCNVYHYQKGGIVINGEGTNAEILDNTVTGLGPVSFIAQNGIQFGYGATGIARGNLIDGGHEYTGEGWTSTGLLLFDINASDVKRSKNKYVHNQTNFALVENNSCSHMYGGFYEDYGLCVY